MPGIVTGRPTNRHRETAYRCEVELVGTKGTITLPDAFLPPVEARLLVRSGTAPETQAEVVTFPAANHYAESTPVNGNRALALSSLARSEYTVTSVPLDASLTCSSDPKAACE